MGTQHMLTGVRSGNFWLGVLDVLLVAYLLYRLLLLARGTRALQILGGLGTLLAGPVYEHMCCIWTR